MKYVHQKRSDYDKSVKLSGQICLCYSPKKLKEVEDGEIKIIGEVIKGNSKKEESAKLSVEEKLISVYDEGTFSKLLYKKAAYIAVEGSDGYIAVLDNRLPILLWLLILLIVTGIAIIVISEAMNRPEAVEPYNALPPVDANVQQIEEPVTTEKTTAPEGGGKVGIGYDTNANLSLSKNEVTMEYTNAGVSNHDAVVELYIVSGEKEYLIATSGRVPIGSQLTKMEVADDAPKLSEGLYVALYRVHYYNAKTGEKSLVSSDIKDINLIVKN